MTGGKDMEYTSAEAAKLLRRLNEERDALELPERRRKVFTASLGEGPGVRAAGI